MYCPESFKESDLQRLQALIEDYPFAMLVTIADSLPVVSHIPFLYEGRDAGQGVLIGHLARQNPQCQHLAASQQALVVFQGPHAYVSPSWYAAKSVPTWNYAVVHIRGTARLMENDAETDGFLARLTAVYESSRTNPWQMNLPEAQRLKLLNAIVAFEIQVESIEGKFKLSQNRPLEDQHTVAAKLSESGSALEQAVAWLMRPNGDA